MLPVSWQAQLLSARQTFDNDFVLQYFKVVLGVCCESREGMRGQLIKSFFEG